MPAGIGATGGGACRPDGGGVGGRMQVQPFFLTGDRFTESLPVTLGQFHDTINPVPVGRGGGVRLELFEIVEIRRRAEIIMGSVLILLFMDLNSNTKLIAIHKQPDDNIMHSF
jgi:hypothetical protein